GVLVGDGGDEDDARAWIAGRGLEGDGGGLEELAGEEGLLELWDVARIDEVADRGVREVAEDARFDLGVAADVERDDAAALALGGTARGVRVGGRGRCAARRC